MKRREDFSISKHSVNLYVGDYAKLQALYSKRVGAGKVIRDLVRAHLKKIESDAAQTLETDLGVELVPEEFQ